jgi:phage-related protein
LYINFGMSGWTVETLDAMVTAEIEALPADIRVGLRRVADLIQLHGLTAVGEPHVKHLEGKLWEIRARGRDGIARAFYVTASGRRVIIVRVFVKRTQKTPRREIVLALERARRVVSG